MSIDLRCKYDRSLGEHASEPFGRGLGYKVVAGDLGIPARSWENGNRHTGPWGGTRCCLRARRARYGFETKVAAARRRSKAALRSPRRCAVSESPARARSTNGAAFTERAAPRRSDPSRGTGRERSGAEGCADDPRAVARGQATRSAGGVPKKSMAPKVERRSLAGIRPWRSSSFQGRGMTWRTSWRPPASRGPRTAMCSRTPRRRPGRS